MNQKLPVLFAFLLVIAAYSKVNAATYNIDIDTGTFSLVGTLETNPASGFGTTGTRFFDGTARSYSLFANLNGTEFLIEEGSSEFNGGIFPNNVIDLTPSTLTLRNVGGFNDAFLSGTAIDPFGVLSAFLLSYDGSIISGEVFSAIDGSLAASGAGALPNAQPIGVSATVVPLPTGLVLMLSAVAALLSLGATGSFRSTDRRSMCTSSAP